MKSQLLSIAKLLEIQNPSTQQKNRIVSTAAFDWLYVALSLLVTVGLMMDIWSHIQFGPDQSLFNEYHLLFYGSVSAILFLLLGFIFSNVKQGASFRVTCCPHIWSSGNS